MSALSVITVKQNVVINKKNVTTIQINNGESSIETFVDLTDAKDIAKKMSNMLKKGTRVTVFFPGTTYINSVFVNGKEIPFTSLF